MLKRFTKSGKKQSKSGVILITILFILAVAFILIGSALMMTANTRKRLYTFAEGGQARLTATAAARMFETALQTQEIRDKDFEALCNAGTTLFFQDATVPGMGGSNDSGDNYTKAVFGKTGSKLTVTITTVIGSETENVLLTYSGTPPTEATSPFAFQVEIGRGGRLERTIIGVQPGTSTRAPADDNIVVSRGSGDTPVDSTYFHSTFITTQPFYSASGVHLYGDMVFAGPAAAVDTTHVGGTGSGAKFEGSGYAFFINCNSGVYGSGSQNDSFTSNGDITRVVFSGVGDTSWTQAFTGFGANSVCLVGTNGTITSNQAVITTGDPGASPATGKTLSYYTGNLDQYIDPNYADPTSGATRPSSYQEYADSINTPGNEIISPTGTCPSTATEISTSTSGTYGAGVYFVKGLMGDLDSGPVITINVAGGDVVIYVKDDLTIKNGYFNIVGGTGAADGKKCYFVICPGKSITIDPGNGSAPRGIVSANVHSGGGASDPILATAAPCTYIIGAGVGSSAAALTPTPTNDRGQITVNGNFHSSHIEAMVALYPNTDTANDAGALFVLNADALEFYGRIIADTVRAKQSNFLTIPYCPQYTTGEDPNMLYTVASAYTLEGFDYFYDAATEHTASGLHTP